MSEKLAEFAFGLVNETLAEADAAEVSSHDAFAQSILSWLEGAGVIDEWFVAYYRAPGVEISGYGKNPVQKSLDLYVAIFLEGPLSGKFGTHDLATVQRRIIGFLKKLNQGLTDDLVDALEIRDMCTDISSYLPDTEVIRLFVLTNQAATSGLRIAPAEFDGRPITTDVWDITRIQRLMESGIADEPIVVEFATPLPCLSTPQTDADYSTILSIVPGATLASIYKAYGSRLLELNVRSFLQLKGSVNRGIRETLLHSPERFLAYNNGISATASKVEFEQKGGFSVIRRIHDLQIVNGGQTTASLHSAVEKDGLDLHGVSVQVKLTVVRPELLNEIVPEISRFSNTQNKVTLVDFSSNDSFHVSLEKVSRTLWAPATQATGQESKWFFERARGQYADALARERTVSRQRTFRAQFPLKQKFSKPDVAKWSNSWDQKPWLVSRGAEKNFRAFMLENSGKTSTNDPEYVKRIIAMGIIFKSTERIVTEQDFGGYRANIVTYSIAKISNLTAQRVDLDEVWRLQSVSGPLENALKDVSHLVHKVLMNPPPGTTHVGEWSKRELCWTRVLDVSFTLSPELSHELLDAKSANRAHRSTSRATASVDEVQLIEEMHEVTAEEWFALAAWARETNNLEPWQRQIAFSLGRLKGRQQVLSLKQARQGQIMREKARSKGFRP